MFRFSVAHGDSVLEFAQPKILKSSEFSQSPRLRFESCQFRAVLEADQKQCGDADEEYEVDGNVDPDERSCPLKCRREDSHDERQQPRNEPPDCVTFSERPPTQEFNDYN